MWPAPVPISAAQLAYMLDGIDWRNPVLTWRPSAEAYGQADLRQIDSTVRIGDDGWPGCDSCRP